MFFLEEEESESEGSDVEEVLSSDEDEIDEQGQEYLENLAKKAINSGVISGMPVNTTIADIDNNSDDDDSDFEANEDMVLEAYNTPLDEDDCEMDEYVIFKETLTSKFSPFN